MSDKSTQATAGEREGEALLRLLRGKGWGHCDLETVPGPTLLAQATMKYELGPGQAPESITIIFRPRRVPTHLTGFAIVHVDLNDGRRLYGDLMPGPWLSDDLTAEDFCKGVAALPRPKS